MTDAGRARPWLLGCAVALLVLIVDQASKEWALSLLQATVQEGGRAVEVTSFLNLVLVWNTGVSFGLMALGPHASWGFIVLAVLVSTALGGWLLHTDRVWLQSALGGIIGGAIGNVVDRVRFDAVVDFLDFHWGDLHWYVFNVADAAIVVGAVMILADSLFFSEKSDIEKDE